MDPGWLDRVETQAAATGSATAVQSDEALPSRAQLRAWALECGLERENLLDRAKQLLPEKYPQKLIPQPSPYPATPLPPSPQPRDWQQAGPADAKGTVGAVISLLQAGAGMSSSVDMTFTGPLLRALSSTAGTGSALDPLMRSLARQLESGVTVRQMWSVQAQSGSALNRLRLLRDLLTLNGLPGSSRVLASTQSGQQGVDIVAAEGLGGILILEQPAGFS